VNINQNRFFVLGDIHGMYNNLETVIELITSKAKFDLTTGDQLVSLGDKNDRGKDTYKVIEWFRQQYVMFPENIHMITGNHEDMILPAASGLSDLMYWNGGGSTLTSYAAAVNKLGAYGKADFYDFLRRTGHYDFINENHKLYLETDKYFFSHAPIPKKKYRENERGRNLRNEDFRTNRHLLTWSYYDGEEVDWVDPNPCKGKICVYGHVHGMFESHGYVVVPGVRKYKNAIIIDTGSGCAQEGYLTCLELPSLTCYDSRGRIYNLLDKLASEQELAKQSD